MEGEGILFKKRDPIWEKEKGKSIVPRGEKGEIDNLIQ